MENPLQENGHIPSQMERLETKIQIRAPKRVIHCSDGVIEEFSDEEVDSCDKEASSVDPVRFPVTYFISKQTVRCLSKATRSLFFQDSL